ncbi:MAG: tyrosine-type recombinase/integrase [Porphyromonas sp.]|nr:tyrosine-type recombinase/integrase [Porphyromonas sp.]
MTKSINFTSLSAEWLADKAPYIKRATYSVYALQLERHLLPYFGDCSSIQEEQVQNFVLEKLTAGLSPKTIKDLVIVLKMVFRYGCKVYGLPLASIEVKYPKDYVGNKLEVLTLEHQRKLMSYIQDHFSFRNLGLLLCLSTGLRIGEVCALRWSDIDLAEGVVRVRRSIQRIYIIEPNGKRRTEVQEDTPKTPNSLREIPLNRALRRTLRPLLQVVRRDNYILTNEPYPTEPRTYREYYRRLMNSLGIPAMKFHGLRHSFATRCIECGCDYKTVSVLLGHANISTTLDLYVHPNLDQKRRCIDKMSKSLM